MLTLLSGLGLMFSLIIAVGAQNVFVLRQGLRREHVLPVVLICAASDALLVVAGTAGLGYLIGQLPWLLVAARWLGGISLVVYGIYAARRAWGSNGESLVADASPAADAEGGSRTGGTATATRSRLATVVIATLAFTYLNPNVYLDTVLLVGSIAATHGDQRWLFAAGAILASITWFFALGFGARHLGRWLRTPRAWRILDTGIAVLLVVMGVLLVLPVFTG
ncbi:LysE/ArgO family amino acid transporter [Microbacterium arabinogalactanolyticum]|uniref:LysE/ArgO family amino acid transporter n=1 Tax=Microbacterium arabinogalactanolyticum TaxID=69365 RepID=UPI002552F02C|nr:LysE/ArgO family amino acid transporter [Microbacterium arabinogalactanolyticum]GLC86069.1 putative transporter [Microbacterium arabinogalactanolyticum]